MNFEKDYFMRMIQDIVRFLVQLITGKPQFQYEIEDTEHPTACDDLYTRIIVLADAGKINEAENVLYQELDVNDQNYLLMGLSFYTHINDYTDDFLAGHNYSREEIKDGITQLAKEFGVDGLDGLNMHS